MPAVRSAAIPLLLALLCPACAPHSTPGKLTIAAASDLQFALADGVRQFQQQYPDIALAVNYGSSGNFYAQIRNGAPFDLFLSADLGYPQSLARDRIVPPGSVFTYAAGKIAVWVPASSHLDPATALRDPAVRRIAIANPAHAPYGRAAEAALRGMGLHDSVEKKLVLGENISQTLQFAQSGAADTAIVALSLALAPTMRSQGRYWEVPMDSYPKIEQGGAIVKNTPGARAFRDWLLSAAGRALLQQYGFSVPGE